MIRGVVTQREALITILVNGDDRKEVELRAVIDTGFDGNLTLPDDVIEQLELEQIGITETILGDGTEAWLPVYEGWIQWHDIAQAIEIIEANGGPLIGMAMLEGSRVVMHVIEGGEVQITASNGQTPVSDSDTQSID